MKAPARRLNIIVTCGPAAAPIDEVRRITNFSSGQLGVTLAKALARAGHRVFCCKGQGATFPGPARGAELLSFFTNHDLADHLQALGRHERIDMVFHAAALCDFEVARIVDARGRKLSQRKVSSSGNRWRIELKPAPKLLPKLRNWFPGARVVGWKYEMDGSRADALAKATSQIRAGGTAACVVNGAAWGPGFGFCPADGEVVALPDLPALTRFLVRWTAAQESVR